MKRNIFMFCMILVSFILVACASEEQTYLSSQHEYLDSNGHIALDAAPRLSQLVNKGKFDEDIASCQFGQLMGGEEPTGCRQYALQQQDMEPLWVNGSFWDSSANSGQGAWRCSYKTENIWDTKGCPAAVYKGIESDMDSGNKDEIVPLSQIPR